MGVGKLMEGVLAAFAQFDNHVRSDRTRAVMRAAVQRREDDTVRSSGVGAA